MIYSICLGYESEDSGSKTPFRLLVMIKTAILINFYLDLSFVLQIIWEIILKIITFPTTLFFKDYPNALAHLLN